VMNNLKPVQFSDPAHGDGKDHTQGAKHMEFAEVSRASSLSVNREGRRHQGTRARRPEQPCHRAHRQGNEARRGKGHAGGPNKQLSDSVKTPRGGPRAEEEGEYRSGTFRGQDPPEGQGGLGEAVLRKPRLHRKDSRRAPEGRRLQGARNRERGFGRRALRRRSEHVPEDGAFRGNYQEVWR
jgi:hypothetical protein